MSISNSIAHAAKILREGGVVICPTEGVYGISAIANNDAAIARVIAIKQRAENKGLVIVASSLAMLKMVADYDALSADSKALCEQKWPGPYTFIMPSKSSSRLLTGGRDTVAMRVTNFDLLAQLCDLVGFPIISTSANISGSAPLQSLTKLHQVFDGLVDHIIEAPCQGLNKPSTIIDARSGQILRP